MQSCESENSTILQMCQSCLFCRLFYRFCHVNIPSHGHTENIIPYPCRGPPYQRPLCLIFIAGAVTSVAYKILPKLEETNILAELNSWLDVKTEVFDQRPLHPTTKIRKIYFFPFSLEGIVTLILSGVNLIHFFWS